jgi:cytochrome c oxidase assembly protein subunit 15
VPDTIWALDPMWRNIFENAATAQFLHRGAAYLLLGLSVLAAWRFRAHPSLGFGVLAALMASQAALGVVTLINAAPIGLSLAHQGLGTLGFVAAVYVVWRSWPRATTRIGTPGS